MPDLGDGLWLPGTQGSLFSDNETPEQIFARVFRVLRPRTPMPQLRVEFCPFANADSFIRLENGHLHVRISDLLSAAPMPVLEALAYILLGKLYRKPVSRQHAHRYRVYLNRGDVRRQAQLVRQVRGRKFISGPQGQLRNLREVFDALNARFFDRLMACPQLGWSRQRSRSMLGHFDPSHNAIIISRIFDQPRVPLLALEYVMFHEMLHLRYPVDHRGVRRRVHTKEFRQAEKQFPELEKAKELLKRL
ncbi:MAG TPA: hypothetical protein VKU19_01220 [Bryobacteraceae bacterium]|nr:hypothetical protein [Bryobacteraceae bacterium]